MKRLKVMLAIAISIAMITGCGKAASGNNTGQSADGSTGQTATESGEKEEELSVGKSGGALQEGINRLTPESFLQKRRKAETRGRIRT